MFHYKRLENKIIAQVDKITLTVYVFSLCRLNEDRYNPNCAIILLGFVRHQHIKNSNYKQVNNNRSRESLDMPAL